MKHSTDFYHIIIRSHSGRHILLEADRYQKYYLCINAPVRYENLIGKKIPKDLVEYRTKHYGKANEWLRRQECATKN